MGTSIQEQEAQKPDIAEAAGEEPREAEREMQDSDVPEPPAPKLQEAASELPTRKSRREAAALHRRNIVRCNRLILLEAFVLASLVIALILSFVLK